MARTVLMVILLLSAASAQAQAAARLWTTVEGKTFQASLISAQGGEVTLQLTSGIFANVPVARLSPADQAFLKSGAAGVTLDAEVKPPGACASGERAGGAAVARIPIEKRAWPQKVEVEPRAIEIKVVTEDNAKRAFIYCSEHFEIVAPGRIDPEILQEFSRATEGARRLLEVLPWGVDPRLPPLGFYQAKLYDTRGEYAADVNNSPLQENVPSYAVYDGAARVIRVPLNYAAAYRDGALTMVRVVEPRPIVHEVTHQMMHDFLQFIPNWVAEGTAEYVAMLPYKSGVFSAAAHENGIRDYLKNQARDIKLSDLGRLYDQMRMTSEEWNARAVRGGVDQRRLYLSSLLLVYYFSHLDGDGARFLRYFEKMTEARNAWETFFKDPRVTQFPDGRIVARIPLPPYGDKFGFDQLSILLDGRSPDVLQKDIVDAYKKIGVKF